MNSMESCSNKKSWTKYTVSEREFSLIVLQTLKKSKIPTHRRVITRPATASWSAPLVIAWWAQVTLTPELSKIRVFNKGTCQGLKAQTPKGGQTQPSAVEMERLLWKKAQKNLKKKNTSDTINRAIPQRIPNSTDLLWRPWNLASAATSRHHWSATEIISPLAYPKRAKFWAQKKSNKPVVKNNAPIALQRGQGDSSTKW